MIPVVNIALPRRINSVHQIEVTSRCNLRCVYCPSPQLARPKVDMTPEVFTRALLWVKGDELNLAGIGESTLHPLFVSFVAQARRAFPSISLHFATNGLLMTDELAKELAPYRPRIAVSMHRPEKAGPAIEIVKRYGMFDGASSDPSLAATDWAGQVQWHVSSPERPCMWLREGLGFVRADGRISTCSFDASGVGVVGHVDDEIGSLYVKPYELCPKCDQQIGIKGHKQRDQLPQG